jgi:hypothetical protein
VRHEVVETDTDFNLQMVQDDFDDGAIEFHVIVTRCRTRRK